MILFTSSFRTHQIEAVPTSSAVDGFKANVVFKEIEKKLEEVREIYLKYCQEDLEARESDIDVWCCHEMIQVKNLYDIVKY